MQPSLYIETTIPSYLVGGISPNLVTAAHQMATRRWWEERREAYRLFVSSAVDEEIGRGDKSLSTQRKNMLTGLPRLQVTNEVIRIAEEFFAHLQLPASAKLDAFHLAISSHYQIDYLLTWNLKHIAGGRVRLALSRLHDISGIHIPVICTPEELLEWEEQI